MKRRSVGANGKGIDHLRRRGEYNGVNRWIVRPRASSCKILFADVHLDVSDALVFCRTNNNERPSFRCYAFSSNGPCAQVFLCFLHVFMIAPCKLLPDSTHSTTDVHQQATHRNTPDSTMKKVKTKLGSRGAKGLLRRESQTRGGLSVRDIVRVVLRTLPPPLPLRTPVPYRRPRATNQAGTQSTAPPPSRHDSRRKLTIPRQTFNVFPSFREKMKRDSRERGEREINDYLIHKNI